MGSIIPPIVVVDESGPEKGATIRNTYLLVREENKDKLLESLALFMPELKFTIKTKKEHMEWLTQLQVVKQRVADSNKK